MKALIFGFQEDDLVDGLGFCERLGEALDTEIDKIGVLIGTEKRIKGFNKLYIVNYGPTDSLANTIKAVEEDIDIYIGPANKNGTDISVRISTLCNYPMVTEVVEIGKFNGEVRVARQIIGGRGLAYYTFKPPIVLTVPRRKFIPTLIEKEPEIMKVELREGAIKIVEELPKEKGEVDIEAAEIVVGVGRGFKSKDDIKLAFELAKLIGGEVGCSRPIAADFHWLGEDRWIGISGKKIKGKLYIAIGISGAPQHIMAASDTKIIVAVNKDKNAPIFKYADYGVVADLYKFLPVLIERIKKRVG